MSYTIRVKQGRSVYVELPEQFKDWDFKKIAKQVYPYIDLKTRLEKVFIDLAMSYQRMTAGEPKYEKYLGESDEVQFEAMEEGRHILMAKGKKYLCPCAFGEKCIFS